MYIQAASRLPGGPFGLAWGLMARLQGLPAMGASGGP